MAPESTLPETINMKIPSTKQVNFFTMVPSVECGTTLQPRRSSKVPQKGSHSSYRLTFVVCMYRCTGDAKAEHAKSSRYRAKSWSLCKNLHENGLTLRLKPSLTRGSKAACVSDNPLIMKEKGPLFGPMQSIKGGDPLASQLHFVPMRHACCPAGC
jgi:hypothetical protein